MAVVMNMKRLAMTALVGLALSGCATVAHKFGGQARQADAEAAVRARFPIGTRAEVVRQAMEGYGYSCRYYPRLGQISEGLDCADPRPVQRKVTMLVGGFWVFDFPTANGAITDVRVLTAFSPYS